MAHARFSAAVAVRHISGAVLVARLSLAHSALEHSNEYTYYLRTTTFPSPLLDPESNWILLAASINVSPDHQMCSNQKRISLSLIAAPPPSVRIPSPTASDCDPKHNTHGLHTLR
jgi:hypothetical protein